MPLKIQLHGLFGKFFPFCQGITVIWS
ncbi:hypothetical protein ACFX2I_026005 [Malus domestica]